MISARIVVVTALTCLIIGGIAMALVFQDVGWARYVTYAAIAIGGITALVGGIAASVGRIKNDIK
jgi:hypothetical protein